MWSYLTVLLAVPSVVEDPDRTGRLIEDLNYYSSLILQPVWFDTMLSRKYTRDDESEESLRIIKESGVFDMALYFDFGGIRSKILTVDPKNSNISTAYAKMRKAVLSDIESTFNTFGAMTEG